ncbi:uncharacterized protein HGUI_00331 [Hanseniaspora guilliermondii]|uniref:Tyrosine-protein phosphatase OCA6 n=1 Tax=Hanseniaspora guilliermondii TaxID=56406 RepID=A0A1L0AZK5_9ASCO|nr:uncharacterized protein HGUI_00331 [Hanseniaspora guilliermondii]
MDIDRYRPSALYTTPLQFQIIEPRLYRGIFPTKENLSFLKTLQLKTIITILPDNYDIKEESPYYQKFIDDNKIDLRQFVGDIKWKSKNKDKKLKKEKTKKASEDVKRRDKTVGISVDEIYKIMDIVTDAEKYPIFIHDLTNETVTPLVVAVFRKFAYWNLVSILDEFIKYSGSVNIHERKFIEEFPIKSLTIKNEVVDKEDNTEDNVHSNLKVTAWIRRISK